MEKKNKIAGFLINTILALSVCLFAISLFTYIKNKGEVDREFLLGIKPIHVMTDSMDPYIKKESLVFAKKYTFEDTHKGDVILYYHDEKLFTHRVIDVLDDGLRTQGDNSDQMDAYTVKPSEVIGIVFIRMNWIATFLIWLKEGSNWLVLLSIIILVIAIIAVSCAVVKTIKKKQDNKPVTEQEQSGNKTTATTTEKYTDTTYRAKSFEETQNTSYVPDQLRERLHRR